MNSQLIATIYNLIEAREICKETSSAYGTSSPQFCEALTASIKLTNTVENMGAYARRLAGITYFNVLD